MAAGSALAVVILTGFTTDSDRALVADCAGFEASVTRTVKFDVPFVVGVPEITPADDSDRPAGRVPEASDHEYGVVPPVAVRDLE